MLLLGFLYLWCAGITLSNRRIGGPAILAALLMLGYYMAISGGPGDWGPFRHPAIPIICVLAGCGLGAIWSPMTFQLHAVPPSCAVSHLAAESESASISDRRANSA